ncbi:hypothetical protein ACMFMG_011925 [Clarireedia jacksonii]
MNLATRIIPKIEVGFDLFCFTLKPECDLEEEASWWLEADGALEDSPSKNEKMLSLDKLFDRPWFKQLWTAHLSNILAKHPKNSEHITMLYFTEMTRSTDAIVELMESMRGCECSDDRDGLYGVFSLLDQDHANLIKSEPNYSKTASEVYRKFAMACYEKTGKSSYNAVLQNYTGETKDSGLVTFWSSREVYMFRGIRRATGNSKALASVANSDRNILKVTGKYCTTIDNIKPLPRLDLIYASAELEGVIRRAIMDIAPKGILCKQYQPMRNKTLLEAFTRTILIAFEDDTSPHLDMGAPYSAVQNVVARLLQNGEPNVEEGRLESTMLKIIHDNFMGSPFFTTEEGYIGLAPDTAAPGDVLVVSLGSDSPVLLRPTMNGRHYNVIGTCHV